MKLFTLLAALSLAVTGAKAAEYPGMGADIYDVHASASDEVARAIVTASIDHKAVLLDFGANWCIMCRKLHHLLETDPALAKALKSGFVVVMVDVNTRNGVDRNADVVRRYGNPIAEGVPDLVVLDAAGRQLVKTDAEEFDVGDEYVPAKVAAYLAHWAPRSNP